jgi:hypothetical protein
MTIVGVVKTSVDQIILVIAVRYGFVAAAGTMLVIHAAARSVVAFSGIHRVDCDRMFLDSVTILVMQVPVVDIVDMPVVADGGMPAVRSMHMVVRVMVRVARHRCALLP